MAVGKNIAWKMGKGKQYHLPYDIKAVRKKNGDGEEYKL